MIRFNHTRNQWECRPLWTLDEFVSWTQISLEECRKFIDAGFAVVPALTVS